MKQIIFSLMILSLVIGCKTESKEQVTQEKDAADLIIESITIPEFPDNNFSIMDYGAVGDGITDNTLAIKDGIQACVEAGGGKVVIPAGKFLTGPIHLKSNVNLHLEKNSEVIFTKDKQAYLPAVRTSYEGVEL